MLSSIAAKACNMERRNGLIKAYRANCEAISLSSDDGSVQIPDDIVWIDLVNPDRWKSCGSSICRRVRI